MQDLRNARRERSETEFVAFGDTIAAYGNLQELRRPTEVQRTKKRLHVTKAMLTSLTTYMPCGALHLIESVLRHAHMLTGKVVATCSEKW
jgi:hypothetical protein